MRLHRLLAGLLALLLLTACGGETPGTESSASSAEQSSVPGKEQEAAERVSRFEIRFEDEDGDPVEVVLTPTELTTPEGEVIALEEDPEQYEPYLTDYDFDGETLCLTLAGGCTFAYEMYPADYEAFGLYDDEYGNWYLRAGEEGASTESLYAFVFRGEGEKLKQNSGFELLEHTLLEE